MLITASSKPPFTDRYSCQLKVIGANLGYHCRFETSGDKYSSITRVGLRCARPCHRCGVTGGVSGDEPRPLAQYN